ncbi:MAG: hypothetical protein AAFY25_00080 [Pseudomonadota bacterium]
MGTRPALPGGQLADHAEQALSDVFAILQSGADLSTTLDALIDFACDDPRMKTGCLFYKMRTGKHRLGPKTRARIDEIEAAAVAGYAGFLAARHAAQDWSAPWPVATAAHYISEQIALAFTQRASGVEPARIRTLLVVAFSVFRPQCRHPDDSRITH